MGAMLGKFDGNRLSNTPRGAGNDCNFILEEFH
jgi:hypothetical protein